MSVYSGYHSSAGPAAMQGSLDAGGLAAQCGTLSESPPISTSDAPVSKTTYTSKSKASKSPKYGLRGSN